MKIAHIINPVKVSPQSDLYIAQPYTFDTMQRARMNSSYREDIYQFAIGFEEDRPAFPKNFLVFPDLNRSVLDIGDFRKKRKLPLITDLFAPLMVSEEFDYVVYTNVDIALMPFFYDYIFTKIREGSDCLIINRRVIEEKSDLIKMYSSVGKPHPGYDCFVFRRELIDKFILGHTCIGANWIGRVMIANLIAFSENVEIIKDAHLTFHIGDDGAWLSGNYSEFDLHNKREAYQVIDSLLRVIREETKKGQLLEIKTFIDNWGRAKISPQNERISLSKKIKFKLNKILK